jgi:hypothetical protein
VARIGGTIFVRSEFWGVARSSDLNATGRDIIRANKGVRYQQVWDLAAGTQIVFEHESRLDHFVIDQDDASKYYQHAFQRIDPALAPYWTWQSSGAFCRTHLSNCKRSDVKGHRSSRRGKHTSRI